VLIFVYDAFEVKINGNLMSQKWWLLTHVWPHLL